MCGLGLSKSLHGLRGLNHIRLVINKREVDVVVFGLAANTKTTRLQSGKQNTDQLAEASRVENCDSLRRAS